MGTAVRFAPLYHPANPLSNQGRGRRRSETRIDDRQCVASALTSSPHISYQKNHAMMSPRTLRFRGTQLPARCSTHVPPLTLCGVVRPAYNGEWRRCI